MPDTIYKVLENCEVKKVGERQYEFTASTADMDRDGEVIDVSGWDLKNFKKNPVIMFGHDYRSLPIGKATKIGVRDGKLVDVVEFPPEGTYEFADTVARLVDAGYLKTQSVGFIPKKWEDGDGAEEDGKGSKPRRTYTKQELLEISIVPVPSNPNALMNAVKEGVITQKQFNSITKTEEETPKPSKTPQEQIIDEIDYLTTLIKDNGMNEGVKESALEFSQKVIVQLKDKIPKDNAEIMIAIGAKALGYGVPIEHYDIGKNGKPIKGLDLRISSSDKPGEMLKMDMGKMQEMHDMMASAETMAKKSKKMAEDMMSEYEDMDEDDMKRISGSDIPVKNIETFTNQDILESLKRISNIGG